MSNVDVFEEVEREITIRPPKKEFEGDQAKASRNGSVNIRLWLDPDLMVNMATVSVSKGLGDTIRFTLLSPSETELLDLITRLRPPPAIVEVTRTYRSEWRRYIAGQEYDGDYIAPRTEEDPEAAERLRKEFWERGYVILEMLPDVPMGTPSECTIRDFAEKLGRGQRWTRRLSRGAHEVVVIGRVEGDKLYYSKGVMCDGNTPSLSFVCDREADRIDLSREMGAGSGWEKGEFLRVR